MNRKPPLNLSYKNVLATIRQMKLYRQRVVKPKAYIRKPKHPKRDIE